jgi:hypothetical protein
MWSARRTRGPSSWPINDTDVTTATEKYLSCLAFEVFPESRLSTSVRTVPTPRCSVSWKCCLVSLLFGLFIKAPFVLQ